MKNRKIIIDLINLILGVVIIVLALMAFSAMPMNRNIFPVIFAMGTAMLYLNAVKVHREHRMAGVCLMVLSLITMLMLIISLLQLMI